MTASTLHILNDLDNVAVALRDLSRGERLTLSDGNSLLIEDDVERGHKVALRALVRGDLVFKFGHVIGRASTTIVPGAHVHTHNLQFVASAAGDAADSGPRDALEPPLPDRRTFDGIRRSDGTVATRNFLAVISTVNCSATVVRRIADGFESSGLLDEYPTIDGVVAVTHDQGCGHGGPLGLETLRRTIRGYATHPNVGGVVLVGLGCEMNLMEHLLDEVRTRPEVPVTQFAVQDVGGTRAAITRGIEDLRKMAPMVADVEREKTNVSELVIGLNCGGSDGWSSITANPALGYASDLIVAQGGRTILAETPEIYGAEDLLLSRAVNAQVRDSLRERLQWWEEYTATAGGSMDNNPSPGNKSGGITTILEKSLGAVAKSGTAALKAVYQFAEPITARGLSFMDTPGYDPVSVTGLVAGGCTLIAFTTGRGSAIGTRPAPTIKIATNSDMYRRMKDDMDIDSGDIVDQGVPIEEKGLEIYHEILDVASGKKTRSEILGYGENEFVPWHLGAVT